MIALGDINNSWMNVYIANRPPLDEYTYLDELKPLKQGEIAMIAQLTGNHWRKIFNVFAKFMFSYYLAEKTHKEYQSWQEYRDKELLKIGSETRLIFSGLTLEMLDSQAENLHIIMGKQYAAELGFDENQHEGMVRLDNDFAIWPQKKLIVCPYFDYRQLSNIKIDRLIDIIKTI